METEAPRRGRPRKLANPLVDSLVLNDTLSADSSLAPEPEIVAVKPQHSSILSPASVSETRSTSVAPDPIADPKGYEAYVAELRAKRKPYGAQMQKLAYPPRSGYKRHWFNDIGGRIQEYQDAGWSVVNDDKGRPVQRTVGAARDNTPLKAHLMEIPSVFWEEVEAERHALAKAKMDDIKSSPIRSKPGEAKASDAGKFYSPKEEMVSMTESLSRR